MTAFTDFWPTVPSRTDAELKGFALIIPANKAADYMSQRNALRGKFNAGIKQLSDGSYAMCADLLREFHPDTATGLYPGHADILLGMQDDLTVEDWDTAFLDKRQPSQPADLVEPPVWDQPVPGRGNWYDKGYPFGALVKRTIDGVEYVRRSLIEFNTVDPATIDARYWEFDPPQAIPWKIGQVWNTGDVVNHVSTDLPENDTWRSKINANTTEPNTDAGNYRYWEPIGDTYDPYAPKEFVSGRAYSKGEKCIENSNIYKSTLEIPNVWAPSVFPAGWELTGPA